MRKRQNIRPQIFVLEISGRAVLAFPADGIAAAKELCSQSWFTEELGTYRSCGHRLWDGMAELKIRAANVREAAELQIDLAKERARDEYEGYVFTFLVRLDADLQ
jgi:hypothetical protein